jgi:hypothetical protein
VISPYRAQSQTRQAKTTPPKRLLSLLLPARVAIPSSNHTPYTLFPRFLFPCLSLFFLFFCCWIYLSSDNNLRCSPVGWSNACAQISQVRDSHRFTRVCCFLPLPPSLLAAVSHPFVYPLPLLCSRWSAHGPCARTLRPRRLDLDDARLNPP